MEFWPLSAIGDKRVKRDNLGLIFLISQNKQTKKNNTYIVIPQQNGLAKTGLMRGHNISLYAEIWKILPK